ncbi:MAG: hypothetical protein VKL59_18805 [Nostocaceae cyanobacterium]|nr:hypothetical protein [Nostocaceae cyanobacterium]
MLEKLLLATSVTISLQFCVSLGAFSAREADSPTVTASQIASAIEIQLNQILQ